MEGGANCGLCCFPVNNNAGNTVRSSESLTTYLYHKNVRETLLPSPTCSGREKGVPVMTFTFSLDGTQSMGSFDQESTGDTVLVCEGCQVEMNQLEVLHQQLESCKKLVAAQVERIENICENPAPANIEESRVRNNQRGKSVLRENKSPVFGLDVALAGTSIGKENISSVLRCLEALCEGVTTTPRESPPVTVAQSGATTMFPQGDPTYLNTDQRSNSQRPAGDFYAPEPIIPDTFIQPGAPNEFEYRNERTTRYTLETSTGRSITAEKEIREMFSHPVKLEPLLDIDFIDESDVADPYAQYTNESTLPEDDPIPTTSKESLRSNNSLPEFRQFAGGTPTNPGRINIGKIRYRKKQKGSIIPPVPPTTSSPSSSRFVCDMCGKRFRSKADVTKHFRTHTGERPYQCEMCHSFFTQSSHLHRHIRKAHGNRKEEDGSTTGTNLSSSTVKIVDCSRDFDMT